MNQDQGNLVQEAIASGLDFFIEDDKLKLRIPKGVDLDKNLLEAVKLNGQVIKDYLLENGMHSLQQAQEGVLEFARNHDFGNQAAPLSYGQESIWFIDRLQGSFQYHMHWSFHLKGLLDVDALSKALDRIVERHQVLSTIINDQDDTPKQELLSDIGSVLEVVTENEFSTQAEFIKYKVQQPIHLDRDQMLRAVLIPNGAEDHTLLLIIHHFAFDGLSAAILLSELKTWYEHFTVGKTALADIRIQYADYARWQRSQFEVSNHKGFDFWQGRLEGLQPLNLSTDFPRTAGEESAGASISKALDQSLVHDLRQLHQSEQTTLFNLLFAAFNALMYRYTGQEDICIGCPVDVRSDDQLDGLIGYFVNTLPLRNQVDPQVGFSGLLHQITTSTKEAFAHRQVPLEKMAELTRSVGDTGKNAFFNVVFVLQDASLEEDLSLGELVVKKLDPVQRTTRFDLELHVLESGDGLALELIYAKGLFDKGRMQALLHHYENILQSAIQAIDKPVAELSILDEDEFTKLSDPIQVAGYPDKSIVELFQLQAKINPDHIALKYGEVKMSYGELDLRSTQFAHLLQANGVTTGQLVPICTQRTLDFVVGVLGILKAGGAYVPIDPKYPGSRIDFILADTAAEILVVTSETSKTFSSSAVKQVFIDGDLPANSDALPIPTPDQNAYLIYTSGSTGQPKGVLVSHQNLVSLIKCEQPLFDFTDKDVWTLFHSFSFDFSVWELFGPLLTGGKVVLIGADLTKDLPAFGRLLVEEQVTVLNQTPSVFYALQEHVLGQELPLNLRYVIFGGEALSPNRLQAWHEKYPSCALINMYGITETTVHVTIKQLTLADLEAESSNIGIPIPTLGIHLLDANGQLVPQGVPGEIHVAGAGVTQGYLNRAELTAQRYIANPFGSGKLYRSGDLAKWLPNGELQYLGRADKQVKIRGFRIELGEVETILNQYPSVTQSVVLADQGKRLLAFVVSSDSIEQDAIKEFVRGLLPGYMVPANVWQVDKIPQTINGKVDQGKLLQWVESQSSDEKIAPRNEQEAQLVTIWKTLLQVDEVGIEDNFFDLGGHSLLVTRLATAIRKELEVEVQVKDIFEYPTIASLAKHLQTDQVLLPALQAFDRPTHVPLSFAQERLYFIHKLHGSLQYHMPIAFRIQGGLNVELMEQSFRSIIQKHEVLRTVIYEEEGTGYQRVLDASAWQILHHSHNQDGTDEELFHQLAFEPFDLQSDYMLRADLVRNSESDHLLVLTIHHIASDGWSLSVITDELMDNYNQGGGELTLLPVQYADYALWQRNLLTNDIEDQLSYWTNQLNEVKPTALFTDYPPLASQSHQGAVVDYVFDADLYRRMKDFARQHQVTLFMELLSAFKVLLHHYTLQTDLCVGIPIAGRRQAELEGMIGFFVNTLAVRNQLDPGASFIDFLKQVERTTLDAYQNQDAPFEQVVEEVAGKRRFDNTPLFNMVFVLQNTPELQTVNLEGLEVQAVPFRNPTSVFDFVFDLKELDGELKLQFRYCSDLFGEETVHRFIDHYTHLVRSLLDHADRPIDQISFMPERERHLIQKTFNQPFTLPKQTSLIEAFETIADTYPQNLALSFGSDSYTYLQLNEKANRLAHHLVNSGVTGGELVPVGLDRSANFIIAMLGVLKAGAAYVPLDLSYPEERILHLIDEVKARHIIVDDHDLGFVHYLAQDLHIVDITTAAKEIDQASTDNPESVIQHNWDIANVIFTSGSTGKPKGVQVTHANILSLVLGTTYAELSEKDTLLATGSPSFDASTFEYWGMLLNGGHLVMATKDELLDNEFLKSEVANRKVTKMWFTASWYNQLVDTCIELFENMDMILVGGEKLSEEHIYKVRSTYPKIKIVNGYGPTENTTFSLTFPIHAYEELPNIPIGRPLENRSAFIILPSGELAPIGVPGELCVGGAGVSMGYLNSPSLNDEKFIEDAENVGFKQYRTGDLARWMSDGNVQYMGRVDQQIKIRGHRVEIGEIEHALNLTEGVLNSVVIPRKEGNSIQDFTGFFVPEPIATKAIEREQNLEQVSRWKELYESEYGKTEEDPSIDEEFNIIGWNDSFTTQPIPAADMRLWLEDIIRVINAHHQGGNILEIGCGTGLIFFALEGKYDRYVGTDFSVSSIKQVEQRVASGVKDYGTTAFKLLPAHELNVDLGLGQIDLTILNSIVQYFPTEQYLTDVIRNSIEIMQGEGRIILGDVRDHRLLPTFKARLLLGQLEDSLNTQQFKWQLDKEILSEEELCLDPQYFLDLKSQFPEISHVEWQWKDAAVINELTCYRYTVILHLGKLESKVILPEWQNWEEVSEMLLDQHDMLAIKNLPNYRLIKDAAVYESLSSQEAFTTEGLINNLTQIDAESQNSVQSFLQAASAKGFKYRLLLQDDPFKMDMLLSKGDSQPLISQRMTFDQKEQSALANIPLFADVIQEQQIRIRKELGKALPDYMIPSHLIALRSIPLTFNGKADRQFLADRVATDTEVASDYTAPGSTLELKISEIWKDLLGKSQVSIHDDFFELGGHSLLASRVVATIGSTLNLDIKVKDLFMHPTVAGLAEVLESRVEARILPPITANHANGEIPLSFAQERISFIDKLQGSVSYHMPWVFHISGDLNVRAMESAFRTIIDRHQILRSVLLDNGVQSHQELLNAQDWKLSLSEAPEAKEGPVWDEFLLDRIFVPFDLSKDFMVRAEVIEKSSDEFALLVVFHHIAFDGWSISVLVQELVQLYRAAVKGAPTNLPELAIQYGDYAAWQQEHFTGPYLEDLLGYWKQKLKDVPPLNLPTDFPRPHVQSTRGQTIYFYLDKTLSEALRALSAREGVTLFMTMLAAYKVLLFKYTRQKDIAVGVAIANRTRKELESLIGFFVNAIVIRSQIEKKLPFNEFLAAVKQTTLEAYEYQDAPFEKVIETVVGKRKSVGTPMIQAMFVLQNTPDVPGLELDGLSLKSEVPGNTTSKFDITYDLRDKPEGIEFRVEYCSDLFTADTITRMFTHYRSLLEAITRDVSANIKSLNMLDTGEANQLLQGFSDPNTKYATQHV